MSVAVVSYKRDDGRYQVIINGQSRVVHSTLDADLTAGRRGIVSNLSGRRYITEDLGNYAAANRTTVIINA